MKTRIGRIAALFLAISMIVTILPVYAEEADYTDDLLLMEEVALVEEEPVLMGETDWIEEPMTYEEPDLRFEETVEEEAYLPEETDPVENEEGQDFSLPETIESEETPADGVVTDSEDIPEEPEAGAEEVPEAASLPEAEEEPEAASLPEAEESAYTETELDILDTVTASGSGTNLSWVLDSDGTLTISGTGEMDNLYIDYEYLGLITNIVINSGATSISTGQFGECSRLVSITIPDTVVSIDNGAFSDCLDLADVYYSGTRDEWLSVSVGMGNEILGHATIHCSDCNYREGDDEPYYDITLNQSVSIVLYAGQTVWFRFTPSESGVYTCKSFSDEDTYGVLNGADGYMITSDDNSGDDYNFQLVCELEADSTFYYGVSSSSINTYSYITILLTGGNNGGGSGGDEELVDSGTCGANAEWTLTNDGTLTISGTGDMYDYWAYGENASLPPWNSYIESIQSIVVENGITSIGAYAFDNCHETLSISLPNSVTRLNECCMGRCRKLPGIRIPAGVTSMGAGVLSNCDSLNWIEVDEDNPVYDSRDNCNALIETETNILLNGCLSTVIPSGVTTIGSNAFACVTISGITIPEGVTSIEYYGFAYNFFLRNITIPVSMESIGLFAFKSCGNLSDVYYAGTKAQWNAITIAPDDNEPLLNAVIHCSDGDIGESGNTHPIFGQVTDLVLNEAVIANVELNGQTKWFRYIPSVSGNYEFTSLSDGDTYASMANDSGMLIMADDNSGENDNFKISCFMEAGVSYYFGVKWNADMAGGIPVILTSGGNGTIASGTCGDEAAWELTAAGTLTISGSGDMYDYEFSGNTPPWYSRNDSITEIVIEDGVTSIGEYAFICCTNVTDVTIASTVARIGADAFESCDSLREITIPEGVETIEAFAFSFCESLEGLLIPASVTSIGEYLVDCCYELTCLSVDPGNTVYDSRDNCNAIIETETDTLLCGCRNTVIPSSVKRLGTSAFESCIGLTNIAIPEGVESIGNAAFAYCDNLTEITIPTSMKEILKSAFAFCYKLTDVYYAGTKVSWNAINIGEQNEPLLNATIHYEGGEGIPDGWQEIGGKWYYYKDGAPETGFVQDGGKFYYFDKTTGAMKTGFVQDGGKFYYFSKANGTMQFGFVEAGGKYYYFSKTNGTMQFGFVKDGSTYYYFSKTNGTMQTGVVKDGSKYYYFTPSTGAMHTGWLQNGSKWYYFSPSTGAMVTGTQVIGGKTYKFNSSGVCVGVE